MRPTDQLFQDFLVLAYERPIRRQWAKDALILIRETPVREVEAKAEVFRKVWVPVSPRSDFIADLLGRFKSVKGDTVININLYIHPAPVEVTAMFEQILQQLAMLTKAEKQEAQAMSQLEDQVSALEQKIAAENDAVTGAEGLLTNLSQLYKDALASGGNADAIVERIKAVNAAVDAKTADLAASVVANTPAAPTT